MSRKWHIGSREHMGLLQDKNPVPCETGKKTCLAPRTPLGLSYTWTYFLTKHLATLDPNLHILLQSHPSQMKITEPELQTAPWAPLTDPRHTHCPRCLGEAVFMLTTSSTQYAAVGLCQTFLCGVSLACPCSSLCHLSLASLSFLQRCAQTWLPHRAILIAGFEG